MISKKNIWLDTDPGLDDLFAFLPCCYHPAANLIGVSSVAGNLDINRTTQNSLDILHMFGRDDVPVIRGAEKPILRDCITCPEIHGEVLGKIGMKKSPKEAITNNSYYEMYKLIMAADGPVTLICIAPLTNIAILLRGFPDVKSKIAEILFLGGGIFAGNVTSNAEFNAFCDPEAFQMVLNENLNLKIVPIDGCFNCQLSSSQEVFDDAASKLNEYLKDFFACFKNNCENFGKEITNVVVNYNSPVIIYDAVAVIAALEPNYFQALTVHVDVELSKSLTYGTMVVQRSKKAIPNSQLIYQVDRERFLAVMKESEKEAEKKSPYNK